MSDIYPDEKWGWDVLPDCQCNPCIRRRGKPPAIIERPKARKHTKHRKCEPQCERCWPNGPPSTEWKDIDKLDGVSQGDGFANWTSHIPEISNE